MKCSGLMIVAALALTPFAAEASGSWAVPRFTPTWAELQRDLKALGFKPPPPVKKRPPVARKKVEPTKIAEGTKTETDKTGAEGVKTSTEGTNNQTPTEQRMIDSRTVPPPIGTCQAYCVPLPVCVDSSPRKDNTQQQPQPIQNVTPPQSEVDTQQDSQVEKDAATNTATNAEKQPAEKTSTDKKSSSKKSTSKTGKTGRPKADDKADEGQLKKKKYWWQDNQ